MRNWKSEGRLFILLAAVSGLILIGDRLGLFDSFRRVLEKPLVAGEERLYAFGLLVGEVGEIFESRQKGEQELFRLQGQLCQLAFDQSRLASCEEENQAMRKLLGAPLPANWSFLPARVIGTVQGLRLGSGSKEGIAEGEIVLSQNILVGRVKSIKPASALVERPGDPGVKIPVVIKRPAAGESEVARESGGVVGKGLLEADSGALFVNQILQEEIVLAGDLVLTSGEAGWEPDLVIGVVEETQGREAEIYKKAKVRPLLEGRDLRVVFVVEKKPRPED